MMKNISNFSGIYNHDVFVFRLSIALLYRIKHCLNIFVANIIISGFGGQLNLLRGKLFL